MVQGYGSLKMTGTNPNKLPDGLGDFLLEQDYIRDKAWLWDRVGALMMDMYGQGSPASILISGGVVTDDGSHTKVNISAGVGYAPYTIDLGTSNAIPPATATEDLAPVRVSWGAQSGVGNINVAGTWYVKMMYAEQDWLSRVRAKAGGSWYFGKKPYYTLVINQTAPSAYEIPLATIVSTGSSFTSIVNGVSVSNVAFGSRALGSNTTGNNNTAVGVSALQTNTTGNNNTAVGANALQANTTGCYNTAVGFSALPANTSGNSNTAVGISALQTNTTGNNNTAVGISALQTNTTGNNTAVGANALQANTTGCYNTAVGFSALPANTTGNSNTAVGISALQTNTTGNNNTAVGFIALQANTTGCYNTAVGISALQTNTTGNNNTAVGANALQANTTGYYNTAVGFSALQANTTGNNNTAVGISALQTNTTGYNNTAVGFAADVNSQYSYASAFGAGAVAVGSSYVRLGRVSTDTLHGYNYTADSDARLKRDVIDIPVGLEFVEKLRPVFFKWKDRKYRTIDPQTKEETITEQKYHRYHAGFIAQELGATMKEMGIDFGAYQDGAINAGIDKELKIDMDDFRETDDMKGIAEGQLISVLVKAVQELSIKVKMLEGAK
jgi:hypothetical protein